MDSPLKNFFYKVVDPVKSQIYPNFIRDFKGHRLAKKFKICVYLVCGQIIYQNVIHISNLFSSIIFFRVLHGVVDPVKAQISPTLSKNLRNHLREEL